MTAPSDDTTVHGWLLLSGPVPRAWSSRAQNVALVPLLPGEAVALLTRDEHLGPLVDAEDTELARLVARAWSAREIAGALRLGHRTVQRRVARLRRRLGAVSKAELATMLAAAGFAAPDRLAPGAPPGDAGAGGPGGED